MFHALLSSLRSLSPWWSPPHGCLRTHGSPAMPFPTSFRLADGGGVPPPQRSSLTSWSKFGPPLPLLFSSVASCSFPFQHFPSFVISLYAHPCVYLLDVFLPHSPVSFWRTESCLFTTFSPASRPCLAQKSCSTLSWVNEGGKGMSE